jgi:hypothetical protein
MAHKSSGVRVYAKAKQARSLFAAAMISMTTSVSAAQPSPGLETPESLGFAHFYKCPSDADVTHLGDTITAKNCLAACEAQPTARGCWWLDGTGGFPRECRVCRTLEPDKMQWRNDWARPLSPLTS